MNIYKFEFKKGLKSALVWSFVSGALIILFVSLFPSMKESSMMDMMTSKMDALPDGMLKAFNINNMMDFSNLFDYLAYSLQYIAIAGGIYGLIMGVNSLVREETEGTIEFLYSKPVSRSEIFFGKLGANLSLILFYLISIFVFITASSFIVKDEGLLVSELINKTFLLTVSIGAISLIFLFVGILLSTIMKSSRNSISIALGLFFATYFIGIIAKLKDSLSFLKYFSPSEYFVPGEIIKNGFDSKFIIIVLVIVLVSLITSVSIYKRKDL